MAKRMRTRKRYSKKRYSKKRYSKKRYSKKRYSKKRYSKKRRQSGGTLEQLIAERRVAQVAFDQLSALKAEGRDASEYLTAQQLWKDANAKVLYAQKRERESKSEALLRSKGVLAVRNASLEYDKLKKHNDDKIASGGEVTGGDTQALEGARQVWISAKRHL